MEQRAYYSDVGQKPKTAQKDDTEYQRRLKQLQEKYGES